VAEGKIWEIKNPILLHGEQRRAEITLSLLQPQRDDVILDVGCGDGYQISYLIKHSSQIIGLDISPHKLIEGKRRMRKADFICASSENLPFRPQVFNRVMCLELLEHLKDPLKTIREIDLVLKNGGIVIISVPYKERIVMMQCIHCGKLTPLYGHLHSFDEERVSSLLPKKYIILRREYICTIVASYPLFGFLPLSLWKIVDTFSRLLPGIKPTWFISKVQKP